MTTLRFAYCSVLAADYDATCVSAIIRVAREFNANHAITGVLIFDGTRFFQYIEGPADSMTTLIDRLYTDPRHTDITVLLHDAMPPERWFPSWSMAYASVDSDTDHLQVLAGKRGDAALTYLQALIPELDIH